MVELLTAIVAVAALALAVRAWAARRPVTAPPSARATPDDDDEARARLAAIVRDSHDAIIAKDATGVITEWNDAAVRLYGYEAAEATGRSIALIVPADRAGEEARILERVLAGETVANYQTRRVHRDGTLVDVSLTVSPIFGADGRCIGASAIGRDITEAVAVARRDALFGLAGPRLASSLDVGSTAIALAEIVVPAVAHVCIVDVVGEDGTLERVAVHHGDAVVERGIWDEHHATRGVPTAVVAAVLATGAPHLEPVVDEAALDRLATSAVHRELAREGGLRSFAILPLVVRGRVIGVASVGFDHPYADAEVGLVRELVDRAAGAIDNARLYRVAETARRSAERARAEMEHAEVRFRVAFEEAPIGVALISMAPDDRGCFLQVNPALCRLTGYTAPELAGRTLMSLTDAADIADDDDSLARLIEGEGSEVAAERRYVHANGHLLAVRVRAKVVRAADGRPLYAVCHFEDVTEQKRYEGQLRYLADHDALTGLFNRRRFEEEVERVWHFVERYDEPASLLVIDLDDFKYVNDTYGHHVGDDVLSRMAALLSRHSRETDVVGRLGGDEFAMLLPHTDIEGAAVLAGHLIADLHAEAIHDVEGAPLHVRASIGIATIDRASKLTAAEFLIEGDVAMYDAKEAGKDRVNRFDVANDRPGRIRARLGWSQRIRDALDNEGFELWEQPIITVATGARERSEILLRMRSPEGDLIPPSTFLYIAEHFGQIQAIDRWVIGRSLDLLAARQAAGDTAHMEVNLSGASITDAEVIDFIVERVRTAAIDPTRLTFEVTETTAIVNIDRARLFARKLADLGCQFALDDFGSGFGSFFYLKHLPFDTVKIDGDFIKNLPRSRTDQLTVQAIVQIAKGLGKLTIAEFVGDAETVGLLRRFGVDYGQGYHLGRPARALYPHEARDVTEARRD
jgi:diguanylate cyclase (GGDEF)-like protein/PAS domain S-box-containing protein